MHHGTEERNCSCLFEISLPFSQTSSACCIVANIRLVRVIRIYPAYSVQIHAVLFASETAVIKNGTRQSCIPVFLSVGPPWTSSPQWCHTWQPLTLALASFIDAFGWYAQVQGCGNMRMMPDRTYFEFNFAAVAVAHVVQTGCRHLRPRLVPR